jgi:hypothetical protein
MAEVADGPAIVVGTKGYRILTKFDQRYSPESKLIFIS